jgi:hypothetical protein
MPRYNNIPLIATSDNPKRRYVTVKYPQIPLDSQDIYVYVSQGDRYDILAQVYYGDDTFWWIINRANPSQNSDSLYPAVGAQIRIPAPTSLASILSRFNNLN